MTVSGGVHWDLGYGDFSVELDRVHHPKLLLARSILAGPSSYRTGKAMAPISRPTLLGH